MRQNVFNRRITAGSVLCCLVFFAGCQGSAPPPATPPPFKGFVESGARIIQINPASKQNRVRGIDDSCVAWMRWCDHVGHQENAFIAFVVWTDIEEGASGPGFRPIREGPGGVEFRLGSKDKTAGLLVKCATTDGKSGPLTVNGNEFELSRGWLILVSASGDKFRMKQLQRETIKETPNTLDGSREFEKLRTDPEVGAFFVKHK